MSLHRIYSLLKKNLQSPFGLLDTVSQRLRFVIVSGLFVILFINIFKPFNIDRWFDIPGRWESLFYSSFGLIAILIIGLSQFAIRPFIGPANFRVADFFGWALGEIIVLSLIFNFLFGIDQLSVYAFFTEIGFTFRYTFLVAGLAYTFALLINRIFAPEKRGVVFSEIKHEAENLLVPFHDENGNFRFGLKEEDLLYLEAADNYVIIHSLEGEKLQNHILRNSLKNLEPDLKPFGILRCHRSFMVRTCMIRQVKKEPKRYLLVLSNGLKIPASPGFYDAFISEPKLTR
jgi:hypothetical protein